MMEHAAKTIEQSDSFVSERDLSIIVPVGPNDSAWMSFILQAEELPKQAEYLFVSTEALSPEGQPAFESFQRSHNASWFVTERGRARQLNFGAHHADRRFLWFVHSDSEFNTQTIPSLLRSLSAHPTALHFFRIEFRKDGPTLMFLNQIGARFRSEILKIPFGDQALCVEKGVFFELGEYSESLPYGEDHYFVWAARRNRISINCTDTPIKTSARKYSERGWLAVTLLHLKITLSQVWENTVGYDHRR